MGVSQDDWDGARTQVRWNLEEELMEAASETMRGLRGPQFRT